MSIFSFPAAQHKTWRRLTYYGLWGVFQSVVAGLPFLALGQMPDRFPQFYMATFAVGVTSSLIVFILMNRQTERLNRLSFPLASTIIPIAVIPGWNFIQCARLWNCDLPGSDAGIVEQVIVIGWTFELFIFGVLAALFLPEMPANP